MEKNNSKTVLAWCMYDWANSAYNLVITSTLFPIYFLNVARNAANGDQISFLGGSFTNSALYSFSISAAFLIVALLNPLLTAIADYSRRKKRFLRLFCWLGAIACGYLYYFTKDTLVSSVVAFILAMVGYSGSLVFYNAFLPEIVTEDRFDAVSAKGYSLGYIGSVILLVFVLVMMWFPTVFGWPAKDAEGLILPFSFLLTAVWWLGFAHYTFYHLPADQPRREPGFRWLAKGFQELRKVLRELKDQTLLKGYLASFFFFSMGVQTVMFVAPVFAKKELKMPDGGLIAAILIIQLVAAGGAYGFARLSARYGNMRALQIILLIWTTVCPLAFMTTTENQFYALAFLVGTVMGGVQSLARSTYAKLIPPDTEDHASYFNFYDLVEKGSTMLGTFLYGLIEQQYSTRTNLVVLGVFFIAGLLLLLRVPAKKTDWATAKIN